MKKAAKWIGIAVLTPILLFLTLTALLYLPPVQNWLADKVASIASEKTGMEISVGTIRLEWPLDIGIDDFRMLHQNDCLPQVRDTIADVAHLTVDVRLLPLFNSRVVIDELSLRKAKINTNGFISDLRIKGEMGELWLSSKGIDLDKETAEINGARLSDANIDLALGDTAAVDTAKSEIRWFVKADSLTLSRTDLTLHMPGDTLCIRTHLGNAVARDTDIDIGKGVYQVACLDWREGAFRYDDRRAPEAKGFDSSHIALTDLTMHVDSFSYSPSGTSLFIKEGMAKERSGIELTHVGGGVRLDSLYNNIQLSKFSVRTTDSDILTDTDMDFNAFDDSDKAGRMMMRLNAQLGKQDLIRFMGELPQEFIRNYPNQPISIKGSLNGNIQNMELTGLNISQPTAFNINLNGTAGLSQEKPSPTLDLKVNAKLQDVNFLLALSDPSLLKSYRIPNGISLDGKVGGDGNNRYSADLTAREGNGTVKLKGSTIIPKNARGDMAIENITYDADLSISNLNLHHFMPKDSLYTLSADMTAKGHGTDFFSTRSHLTADATITQINVG